MSSNKINIFVNPFCQLGGCGKIADAEFGAHLAAILCDPEKFGMAGRRDNIDDIKIKKCKVDLQTRKNRTFHSIVVLENVMAVTCHDRIHFSLLSWLDWISRDWTLRFLCEPWLGVRIIS